MEFEGIHIKLTLHIGFTDCEINPINPNISIDQLGSLKFGDNQYLVLVITTVFSHRIQQIMIIAG